MPLRTFTTSSSLLLFMIGAGLASRAAYSLERQYFINGVGTAAAEAGHGPGSYRVDGNIWKLPYGDPEPGADDGSGWAQLAQSIIGWNNIGTVWTVSVVHV
jgi:high-affinity iron transporter